LSKHARANRGVSGATPGPAEPDQWADELSDTRVQPVPRPERRRLFWPAMAGGAVLAVALGIGGLVMGSSGGYAAEPTAAAGAAGAAGGKAKEQVQEQGKGQQDNNAGGKGGQAAKEGKGQNAADKGGSNGSPSPSHVGLCRAYESKTRSGYAGKALENPAFGSLIEAAGGKGGVAAYCEKILADKERESGNDQGKGRDNDNGRQNGNGGERGRGGDNPGQK
jgi:hypothetical protein